MNSKENYSNVLVDVAEYDTVEDFWRVYNNLVPIEYLPSNTDFFFFKDYIKPQWEDPKNIKGGRWIYDIAWDKNKHGLISQHTERIWLLLVIIMILYYLIPIDFIINRKSFSRK